MMIMISGPFTTSEYQKSHKNLQRLNLVALEVLNMGHIPIVALNASLPVTLLDEQREFYNSNMKIALALAEKCDAILLIGESNGANMEKEVIVRNGGKIFYKIDDVPKNYTEGEGQ